MTLDGSLILSNATIVLPDKILSKGWLAIADGLIRAIGDGEPPTGATLKVRDLHGDLIFPGYTDLHCHGGGGHAIFDADIDHVRAVAAVHLAHGTTSMLASVSALPIPQMVAAASTIASAIDDGSAPNLTGIHFEGPFLSRERAGAHSIDVLLQPDITIAEKLIDSARGYPVTMTIAPELSGAIELIRVLANRVTFFLGHTNADSSIFATAVDAGAKGVTHLFNAMPPMHHRDGGAVATALLTRELMKELILDGFHLDDQIARVALATAGTRSVILVTDAMAAAGLGDGTYSFEGVTVDVRSGRAYLAGTNTLSGSTIFMADAARYALRLGVGLQDVAQLTASNACRLMAWDDRGEIRVGRTADLVVTDSSLCPRFTIIGGVVAAD